MGLIFHVLNTGHIQDYFYIQYCLEQYDYNIHTTANKTLI